MPVCVRQITDDNRGTRPFDATQGQVDEKGGLQHEDDGGRSVRAPQRTKTTMCEKLASGQ
jgi:hypothetical protein